MQQLPQFQIVKARVFCIIDEFDLTYCRDDRGYQYAITERTPGISRRDLKVNDILELQVTTQLPRVIEAKYATE